MTQPYLPLNKVHEQLTPSYSECKLSSHCVNTWGMGLDLMRHERSLFYWLPWVTHTRLVLFG